MVLDRSKKRSLTKYHGELARCQTGSFMLRCHCVSLGCPKNRVDTERLLGTPGLEFSLVDDAARADFIFVNTCGFIRPAVEESVETIAGLIADLEPLCPKPRLVVAGCLIGRYGAAVLAEELPEVDLWLDNRELSRWPALLAAFLGLPEPAPPVMLTGREAAARIPSLTRRFGAAPSYAWLKISDGCRHACSFCTIPFIRGKHHSHSIPALVAEARGLLEHGARELILAAQDVTGWGHDLVPRRDLRHLLDALLPLPGLDWLRLMYLYPTGLNRELLEYLRRAGPPFVPYFDVPFQHAHPDVLRRMGRPFAADPRETVERIRGIFPEAALRTSLIVGFPGESDEQFEILLDFVRSIRFTHLGVFAYEPEEGTPAAAMPGQVADAVKQARKDAVMREQSAISAAWLEQFRGQRLSVLVDAPHPDWPGLYSGRAWFQAPEVDGIVYISGPGAAVGALVEADIVETREYDLEALA